MADVPLASSLWAVSASVRCMVKSKLMGAQNLALQEGLKDKISMFVFVCVCLYTGRGLCACL